MCQTKLQNPTKTVPRSLRQSQRSETNGIRTPSHASNKLRKHYETAAESEPQAAQATTGANITKPQRNPNPKPRKQQAEQT